MTYQRATSIVAFVLACGSAGMAAVQQPAKPDHMQHKFDPATSAKSFDDPARDGWQMPSRVIEALALRPGMSVADIGAGTGYFSMRLAAVSPQVTVFSADIEPAMVAHLKKRAADEGRANVVAVLAGEASPNLPKPVDVILIVNTYHHIGSRANYFKQLRQSLTPSGRVAIVEFRKDAPDGPPVEFRFTVDQIVAEMTQAGFTLDATHQFLPRQNFLIFK